MIEREDVYKISYVVVGGEHPGAIVNASTKPRVGDKINIGEVQFSVIEVVDLMPSRGRFHYLHVTCKPVS